MSIPITAETTVEDAIKIYIGNKLPNSMQHLTIKIFDQYVKDNRGYIEKVLDRLAVNKWAYVQMSMMCLGDIILDSIKNC